MTNTPDTSREAVEPFSLEWASYGPNDFTDETQLVRYDDYAALLARAEKAEAELANAVSEAHFAGYERASYKMAAAECELECKALRAGRDALQAENNRLMAAQAWQPIDAEKPKKGQKVLTYWPGCKNVNPVIVKNKYNPQPRAIGSGDWWHSRAFQQPTHWMPLPTPPTP